MMEPGFGTTLGPRSLRILTYPDRLVNPARPPGRLNDVLYRQEGGWAFPPGKRQKLPQLASVRRCGYAGNRREISNPASHYGLFPGPENPAQHREC